MPPLNTQQRNNAEKAAVELGFGSVDRAKRVMGMDTLTASPSAVNVVPPKIGTEGAALGGMIASQPDYTKQLTDAATASQQTTDQAFNGYLEGLRGKIGETQATAKAYEKKGGVDDLQKKLNTYDQQLAMEQNALRRRQEAIQRNAVGMSAQAISDEVARVERESLAKQADISIIRAGVAQDYSTAKAIADRAVAVQMEQQGNTIEALKLNYERNKDMFDKAEQRAFEAKQKDRENAYNEELAKKKEISDMSLLALENGADGSLVMSIRQANTPEEAQQIAGDFLGPIIQRQRMLDIEAKTAQIEASRQSVLNSQQSRLVERAKLGDVEALASLGITSYPTAKVKLGTTEAAAIQKEMTGSDAYKAVRKGQESLDALKQFEDAYKSYGLTGNYSPIANKELEAKYNAALLNLKEFFNLGVLNGPDEKILRGVLPDPTNQGFVYSPFQGKAATAGIDNMKTMISNTLDDRYLSLKAQYGNYDDTNLGAVKDLDRIYLQNKAALDPGVDAFLKENPDMPLEDKIQVINSKF